MINVEKISKYYGDIQAVKNITLNFRNQETVAITGPSGSGKSTLLRCMNYLEEPSSGKVLVQGQKLTNKNRKKLCLKIGMVFQSFNLFPHMNVISNLIYAPINVLGLGKDIAYDKAVELSGKFGLTTKLLSNPVDLSGGQKQRVAICRALMMSPEIILFDEPTSALDPEVIRDVIEAIMLLKSQMTIIIVTHHIKFARIIADRMIFMDHGQVLADQSKEDFFTKPKSHRARLFLENIGDLM